jgi:DNA-binding FadR family transcriptional regulator
VKSKPRIHSAVARNLGRRIVLGRLKPGCLLERDVKASKRLGVFHATYREALRILKAKCLLHSRPNMGARVSTPREWNLLDPEILSWALDLDPDDKRLNGTADPQVARVPSPLVNRKAAL